MEYKVESSIFCEDLTAAVNSLLRQGWECLGGIAVISDSGRVAYHQAMINKKPLMQRHLQEAVWVDYEPKGDKVGV